MSYLSENERLLIWAVVNAFRPTDCPLTTQQIADRGIQFVEDLAGDGAGGLGTIRLLLAGLTIPILNFEDPHDRNAVRRRLTEMENGIPVARDLARFAQRLATFLIYATLDATQRPAAALGLGYKIFIDRARGATAVVPNERFLPPEIWIRPGDAIPDHVHDVAIVGSGSAGAVLARRLVEDCGLDVAVIENGDYVPESFVTDPPTGIPRPFPWDELENLRRYFKNGGFQLSTGISMFVFQGSCLGGSSVVNNAVCFRMPRWIRDQWEGTFGIPWVRAQLDASYDRIAQDLGIDSADDLVELGFLNPTGEKLRQGAVALGLDPNKTIPACQVNLTHDPKCLGCGYCNLTCGWLRKRSVLQTMLPAAWETAAHGKGKLTVYTGRKALRVSGSVQNGDFRADGVVVRARAHPMKGHGTIRAGKVVVSAGAVASSGLLLRTTELLALGLPIGRGFGFNFGSPVHADYADPVGAFDGLQIAHYYQPDDPNGFVIETWFNPPATQSLALPGWMDDLKTNISRYQYYACAAPLVGSSTRSRVTANGDEEAIQIDLGQVDRDRIKAGLKKTCELFFNSTPPPSRALFGTLNDWELRKDNYRNRIDSIQRIEELQIGTGHPQGGNCLSANPGPDGPGVVGVNFRVHKTAGLYACDASVFPTTLGVNPHWTVMALADLAAPFIAS